MDDLAIIELFCKRSEQAITEASTKYGSLCRTIARNILGNEEDVKECVNDVFLALWNAIPPQSPQPLAPYICKTARNQALKRYHSNTAQKRNHNYDVALDEFCDCFADMQTVEDEIIAAELTGLLNHFLKDLPEKERILFIRRYWYNDNLSEIATHMKMRTNAVTVQLHRTRDKLKKYLQTEGYSI